MNRQDIVVHIGPGIDGQSRLPHILSAAGPLPASHPVDGEQFQHGRIYVARPNCHMLVENERVRVVDGPKENRTRPAINPLFRSAAGAYRGRVTGVILTGLLDDGVAGLAEIKRRGGMAIVQEPSTALFSSMPCHAIRSVDTDYVLPPHEIAGMISKLAIEGRFAMERQEPLQRTLLEQKCPECFGPLWEERQGRIVEYRCRIGHAYSPLSLKAEYQDAVERSLENAMITLQEAARLAEQLARELGPDYAREAETRRAQGDEIKKILSESKG